MARSVRPQVALSFTAMGLCGVGAGVGSVVLPAQISDYGVTMSTIGITFATFSLGFLLAGLSTGWVMSRFGSAGAIGLGAGLFAAVALVTGLRPSFTALVLLQVVGGYGNGMAESVLNAHLASLPGATTLLNRMHAFFGAGALVGPPLAAWMLHHFAWPAVWLLIGAAWVPVAVATAATYPHPRGRQRAAAPAHAPGHSATHSPLLPALRHPAVLLGSLFLIVYVGVEMSVGNWGFSYLTEHLDQGEALASGTMSAYWLGLTLGRFIISPASVRLGWTVERMMAVCLLGVVAALAVVWAVPLSSAPAFALLGFFLGPLFPTAVAVAPRIAGPEGAPAAIGVMNGTSVIGGAALPWLTGAVAGWAGLWTLIPVVLVMAVAQLVVWRGIAVRLAPEPGADAAALPTPASQA